MPRAPWRAAAACTPSRSAPRAAPFQRDRDRIVHATAFRRLTTRRRCSSSTRATTTARGSRTAWRWRRSRAPSRAARGSTRTSPRRSHWRTISATRRSAMPASGRWMQAMAGLRRVRPQRPEPAGRHAARAQVCRLRRPQSHDRDAGGPRQAQRPADRPAARPSACCAGDRAAGLEARHSLAAFDLPAPAEAQVAAIADDIAYISHDIDDGLRAGLIALSDLEAQPLVGPRWRRLEQGRAGMMTRAGACTRSTGA